MGLKITRNKTPAPRPYYRVRQRTFSPNFGPWSYAYSDGLSGSDFFMRSLSHPGPPYHSGGAWLMQRLDRSYGQATVRGGVMVTASTERQYEGRPTLAYSFPRSNNLGGLGLRGSIADAESYGAEGFRAAKPGKPIFGLPQAIAELRDFPSLFQTRVKKFSDLGSNYLNYEFGWKPFLKDLKSSVQVVLNLDKAIRQIRRDNGKDIHRKAIVLRQSQTWEDKDFTPVLLGIDGDIVKGVANSGTSSLQWKRNAWFEGVFRYWIPNIDSPGSDLRIATKLLGISYDATPALVWNLLPFSWMVDWVTNIGDVLENMSSGAAENLVCTTVTCRWATGPAGRKNSTASRSPKL